MQQDTGVTAVAHVIQLAVAPVFLLTGIGAMLSVMTSRLARVVDRARTLEREVPPGGTGAESEVISELSTLSRRAKLIGRSITLCTITALLICAVIAVLFLGAFLQVDTATTVALLFIAAMVAFFLGLLMFLREILLATATLRIGLQQRSPGDTPTGSATGHHKGRSQRGAA